MITIITHHGLGKYLKQFHIWVHGMRKHVNGLASTLQEISSVRATLPPLQKGKECVDDIVIPDGS